MATAPSGGGKAGEALIPSQETHAVAPRSTGRISPGEAVALVCLRTNDGGSALLVALWGRACPA